MSTVLYVVILIILFVLFEVIVFFYRVINPKINKKIQPVKKSSSKGLLYFIWNGLNSPIKRIGFLFFIIGTVIFLVSIININWYYWHGRTGSLQVLRNIVSLLVSDRDFNIGFFLGFYISILGLFMSFFYDVTIKKIIAWIFKARK